MTTIGLAGAGRIGAGLIRLLHTSPAARSLRLKTVLVRDRAKPRPELPADTPLTACPADLTDDPQIDVVVELLGGVAEPFGIVSQALSQGKAVVTANKNLLAERGPEIFALAAERRLPVGFEASVCAGMPIIRTLQEALRVDRITALEGIVNGTSNYLLTRMSEERASYAQCLADAQRLGFAEPDPGYDVSGQDAACKMGILATLAFGACVDFRRLPTSGIDGLALEDVRQAEAMGYRIKLVAAVRRPTGGRVDGEVAAVLLPLHHPLASIRMECNAVRIESEGLGETLLAGRGAGPAPTAVTLLADLLDIAEGRARIPTAGPDSHGGASVSRRGGGVRRPAGGRFALLPAAGRCRPAGHPGAGGRLLRQPGHQHRLIAAAGGSGPRRRLARPADPDHPHHRPRAPRPGAGGPCRCRLRAQRCPAHPRALS